MMKQLIPYPVKIRIRILLNWITNQQKGYDFATNKSTIRELNSLLSLTQDLKPNSSKLNNLQIAISKIEEMQINPSQVFSFWKAVGMPSKSKGYMESRSIVNGELQKSIGGGLCQLSGLIYFIALKAGLEIIERHPHSKDIYTEETRFAPLGSDATVAFGYKDLKIKNNLETPIKFAFLLEDTQITVQLKSAKSLKPKLVIFKLQTISETETVVTTMVNGKVFCVDVYGTL